MKTFCIFIFVTLYSTAFADSNFTKALIGVGTLKNDSGFATYLRAGTDGFTGMDKTKVYLATEIESAFSKNYSGNSLQYFQFKTTPIDSEIENEFDLHLRYAPLQIKKDSSLTLNRSYQLAMIGVKADYEIKADEHTKQVSPTVHLWSFTFDAVGYSYAQFDNQRKFSGIKILHPKLEAGLHTVVDENSALQIKGIAETSFSSGTFSNSDNSVRLSAVGFNSDFSIETNYLFDALLGHNIIFLQGTYSRLDYVNTTDSFQMGQWGARLGYSRRF